MGSTAKHMRVQHDLDSGRRVNVMLKYRYAVTEEDLNKYGLRTGLDTLAMPATKNVVQEAINCFEETFKHSERYYKFEIYKAGIWLNDESRWDFENHKLITIKRGRFADNSLNTYEGESEPIAWLKGVPETDSYWTE